MNARDDLHNIKLKLINLIWITLNSENKFIRVSRLRTGSNESFHSGKIKGVGSALLSQQISLNLDFLKICQGTFNNHVIINIIHDTTNDNIGSKSIQYQNAY